MKVEIELNKFLDKVNNQNQIILTKQEERDIESLLNKSPIIISTDKERIKQIAYFVYNPKEEDIVCEIKDNGINITSGLHSLLASIFAKNNKITVNLQNNYEDIINIFSKEDIILLEDSNIETKRKKKIFLNWNEINKEIMNEYSLNTKVEVVEGNKKEVVNFEKVTYDDIHHYTINNTNDFVENILLKEASFEKHLDVIRYIIEYVNSMDILNKIKNNEDLKGLKIKDALLFLRKEVYDNRVNSLIESEYNKLTNHPLIIKESFLTDIEIPVKDDAYLSCKEKMDNFEAFANKVINEVKAKTKDELLSSRYSSIYIYEFRNLLNKEIFNDINIIKKVLPSIPANGYSFLDLSFLKDLDVKELFDVWKINVDFFALREPFISCLNNENKFRDFISLLNKKDLSFKAPVVQVYHKLSRNVKQNKDVVLELAKGNYDFDYLSDLSNDYFIENPDLLPVIFENDGFVNLHTSVKLSQTKKDRIIKILETLECESSTFTCPKEWLKADILFALSSNAFSKIDFNCKDFNIEVFTENKVENYKSLVERNSRFFLDFPEDIKNNDMVFMEYVKKRSVFAAQDAPKKYLSNIDLIFQIIEFVPSWGSAIIQVLWEDPDFLTKYLEMCENDSFSISHRNNMLNVLPDYIKNIFNALNIKNNYSGFVLKYFFEKTLDEKPTNSKVIKI